MKKLLICLVLIPIILLCGCGSSEQIVNSNFSISLPTNSTEETANGYKNPDSTSSTKTSSKTTETSSKSTTTSSKSSSNNKENSSNSPTLTSKYFGSKNSNVFHIPDCSSAKKIKEENLIIFENVTEAENRGYRPCARCLK